MTSLLCCEVSVPGKEGEFAWDKAGITQRFGRLHFGNSFCAIIPADQNVAAGFERIGELLSHGRNICSLGDSMANDSVGDNEIELFFLKVIFEF